jgi:hypothetical protein
LGTAAALPGRTGYCPGACPGDRFGDGTEAATGAAAAEESIDPDEAAVPALPALPALIDTLVGSSINSEVWLLLEEADFSKTGSEV